MEKIKIVAVEINIVDGTRMKNRGEGSRMNTHLLLNVGIMHVRYQELALKPAFLFAKGWEKHEKLIVKTTCSPQTKPAHPHRISSAAF